MRPAQAPIYQLVVMLASLMLHCIWLTFGSCTLHHALHLKAVHKGNLTMQLIPCAVFPSGPIYRSQRSSATLKAPKGVSTTLIMLYTRQTRVTCAQSYTDNFQIRLPWMAAASSCAISQICSGQTCLNFFQSQLQKSKQMNSQQWRKKTIFATDWIIKQWCLLYVLMSAKAVWHH